MNNIPWIEKYRPTKLEDIIANENIRNKISKIINTLDMDNLLLPGVPGIGKTTTIKCISRALYGKYMNEAVLELNASDDRGIKIVQDKIINFCKTTMDLNSKNINSNNIRKYATFKLIFLDEADNMTEKAQKLINSLMDKYSKSVRFAFTCNNSSDIIEGIQSRCNIIRFSKLSNLQIIQRLKYICNIEKINFNNNQEIEINICLNVIANISDGDLRSAINILQLVYRSYNTINLDNIFNICSKPQPEILKNIILFCINKHLDKAIYEINNLKKNGYCESDIIIGLIYFVKSDDTINDFIKIKLLDIMSYYAYIISKGLSTNLQLNACICDLVLLK